MEKRYITLAVSCLLLAGLAGTAAGAVPCASGPGRAMLHPDNAAGPVTGDNSCRACLEECNTVYPAEKYPATNWFCRFSCWAGSCRLPPVYNTALPNP